MGKYDPKPVQGDGTPMFWMQTPVPGNAGDLVLPWLYKQERGSLPNSRPFADFSVMGCGSIIHLAGRGTRIWGSGLPCPTRRFRENVDPSKIDVRMVRGPRTNDWLYRMGARPAPQDVPYMDPGFLVPRFVDDAPQEYEREIAFVPHYVDLKRVHAVLDGQRIEGEGPTILNPLTGFAGFETYLHKIRTSRLVVASTLHGLIFAMAFGVECVWARWGNAINGGDFKYGDTANAVGMNHMPRVDLRSVKDDAGAWMEEIREAETVPEDYLWMKFEWESMLDRAWEVRPWA